MPEDGGNVREFESFLSSTSVDTYRPMCVSSQHGKGEMTGVTPSGVCGYTR